MLKMHWSKRGGWKPAVVCGHCNEPVVATGRFICRVNGEGVPADGAIIAVHTECRDSYASVRGGTGAWQDGKLSDLRGLLG